MDTPLTDATNYSAPDLSFTQPEPMEARIIDWLSNQNIAMTSCTDKMTLFFQQRREKIQEIRRKSGMNEERQGNLKDHAKRKSLFLKIF